MSNTHDQEHEPVAYDGNHEALTNEMLDIMSSYSAETLDSDIGALVDRLEDDTSLALRVMYGDGINKIVAELRDKIKRCPSRI